MNWIGFKRKVNFVWYIEFIANPIFFEIFINIFNEKVQVLSYVRESNFTQLINSTFFRLTAGDFRLLSPPCCRKKNKVSLPSIQKKLVR